MSGSPMEVADGGRIRESAEGPVRRILHVDMDAFYASVEQRDDPSLRGRPVIVGGTGPRSVVCAASYEARAFGVRSAMSSVKALRLCPNAVVLAPRFPAYIAESRRIQAIFEEFTPAVEPLSLDEAFLDVSEHRGGFSTATEAAVAIRARIRAETGLTASAGVAPNKFLAKVASELRKPDGLFVIPPQRVAEFLVHLPVRKIPGIGEVMEGRLAAHGLRTCGDVLPYSREHLRLLFGNQGDWLFQLVRGHDDRPVVADHDRRSCSIEETFDTDLSDRLLLEQALGDLVLGLEQRLQRLQVAGHTVVLKVKYADFRQVTRSRTLRDPLDTREQLFPVARELLARTAAGRKPVRLLGVGVTQLLPPESPRQLWLPFPPHPES